MTERAIDICILVFVGLVFIMSCLFFVNYTFNVDKNDDCLHVRCSN